MKRCFSLLTAVIIAISFCACNKADYSILGDYSRNDNIPVYDFKSAETENPEGYDGYTTGTTQFAFDLLSQLADEEGNVAVSPHSAATTLSLLANGASESTRKELREVLCLGKSLDVINSGNHYLSSRMSAFNTDTAKFTSANSLWLNDTFPVKQSFLQTAVNYYDVQAQRLLFSEESAKDTINRWVAENTDGEITEVLDNLSESEMLVIINAVLFEDEWATPYTESQISEGVFHGTDGDAEVTYMNSTEVYLETIYARGFAKGFANLPLKFAALLPKEGEDAEELAKGLTASRWQELLSSQQITSSCNVKLPEFEIRSAFNLNEALQSLGINDAFDGEKADFSALTNSDKLYISQVAQQAVVKINSKGVKAAAATTIKGYGSAVPSDEIKYLTFDKPFVFVIYDNESGIPVFTGIVNNIK